MSAGAVASCVEAGPDLQQQASAESLWGDLGGLNLDAYGEWEDDVHYIDVDALVADLVRHLVHAVLCTAGVVHHHDSYTHSPTLVQHPIGYQKHMAKLLRELHMTLYPPANPSGAACTGATLHQ
jgi:hypothetical protein